LRSGADADALDCLRDAVSLLQAGGLFLELPIAAVLLAEAEWRAGHEDEADRAADLALEVSGHQGSRPCPAREDRTDRTARPDRAELRNSAAPPRNADPPVRERAPVGTDQSAQR
jgi:hypothetical protein